MAQHTDRRALLWILVAAVLASGLLATKLALDKQKLASAYAKTQAILSQLQQEQTHLNQELTQARETTDTQASDLTALQMRLGKAEQEISRLQHDHEQLQQTNLTLTQQLAAVTQEKAQLEAKLSSLKELKTAIHLVKQRIQQEHRQAWLARIQAQRAEDQRKLARGNQGYVVRDGVPTIGLVTKLQVRVLEPQTN